MRRARRASTLTAARAEPSAAAMLGTSGSGPWTAAGLGHLLHMPSHTFVRIGRWHDAVSSNIDAHRADQADANACQSPYEARAQHRHARLRGHHGRRGTAAVSPSFCSRVGLLSLFDIHGVIIEALGSRQECWGQGSMQSAIKLVHLCCQVHLRGTHDSRGTFEEQSCIPPNSSS